MEVAEPGPQEVVVVVNNNAKMIHAGLFAGGTLLDPAGSYETKRRRQPGWTGPSLRDYLRFQLDDDGPDVRFYRFSLGQADFEQVRRRVEEAGVTPPFFCAAKVQNMLSGIPPFESVPRAWLVFPSEVARQLDRVLDAHPQAGVCRWPDGSSCRPLR